MRGCVSALLGLALVGPLGAGCLGLGGRDDGSDDERLQKQRAEVSASTGGIEGIVTDTAVQPVAEITVTLVETAAAAATAADGSYAFSQLAPGTYTVLVNATGFVPASQPVDVRANEVATADFLLVHLASDAPYVQPFELTGFFECSVSVGWELRAELSPPLTPVDAAVNNTTGTDPHLRDGYGITWYQPAVSVCSAPNLLLGNTTNDRFLHRIDLDPPVKNLVYGMEWEDATGQAKTLRSILEVGGFPNDGNAYFFRTIGSSPLEAVADRGHFERVQANFTARCDEGTDGYCGYSFFDEGWPLQLRVFAFWTCLSEKAGFCAPVQQPFTHLIDVFYNQPAPAGYSVFAKA